MTLETMDLLEEEEEEEEDLPMKTPMMTCRITSPSPQPLKSELWDPCPGSSMGTGPKRMPFSLNSWDT